MKKKKAPSAAELLKTQTVEVPTAARAITETPDGEQMHKFTVDLPKWVVRAVKAKSYDEDRVMAVTVQALMECYARGEFEPTPEQYHRVRRPRQPNRNR